MAPSNRHPAPAASPTPACLQAPKVAVREFQEQDIAGAALRLSMGVRRATHQLVGPEEAAVGEEARGGRVDGNGRVTD
jgi:hypothetical protein